MTGPQPCPDCGAPAGEEHDDGCDVARCLQTGLQRLSCAVWYETHNCGRDVWTGVWPGSAEAQRYGVDLNTLMGSGRFVWSASALEWSPARQTVTHAAQPTVRLTLDLQGRYARN